MDLPRGKITLRGANGIERVIPVDAGGNFYVDWRLTPTDPRLLRAPIESLLWQDKLRLAGETNDLRDYFRGKLVVVGSAAQGNDLTDRGATPLERDTLLVSKHWNVANSVITGQFIRRASLPAELALIILLGALTAFLTWQLRAFSALGGSLLLAAVYCLGTVFIFVKFRFWLPIIFPVGGAILMEHVSLATYRILFEEGEKRRVRSVFSKIVSPDVVNELLGAEKLSLGGTRREVTVFFADVRGFTTLTDEMQQQVADFIREENLDADAAEKCIDESARETLETVNLYLAAVADAVKSHGGTLDKYIGDVYKRQAIVGVTLLAILSSNLRFATERHWVKLRLPLKIFVTLALAGGVIYLTGQEWRRGQETVWLARAGRLPDYFSPAHEAALEKAFAAEPMNFATAYALGEDWRTESFNGAENYEAEAGEAMKWFARAQALNRFDGYNWLRYGMCLDWLDRHGEAEKYFSQAEALDPNGYYTIANIGWHYVQAGDYAAARPWFRRSLQLDYLDNDIARSYLDLVEQKLMDQASGKNVLPAGF